ncbi:MAG: bifunctional UDP-N-acetylglucosamine diphosphorylase/glucosamine-1-phosphate N-acetyltransferase GlmU [Parvularculaceae bacterium]
MTDTPIAAIVLAAGQGVRMKSSKPKVLHEVGGRTMLAHVMDAAGALDLDRLAVVVGEDGGDIGDAAKALRADTAVAVQSPPRGTADAVKQALPALEGFDGVVLVLYADTPLVTSETLSALCAEAADGAAATVLGFHAYDPGAYGRLKTGDDGALTAIVEAADATPEELEIDLCNSGVMAIESGFLRKALPKIGADNAKGEYYLTDIVMLAHEAGLTCVVIEADEAEVLGVNSRVELAVAESLFQDRMRIRAMAAGATLIDPSTVYFSYDTRLGADVVVGPNVVFGVGVSVADNAEIKAFSHLEGATVGEGAAIGPFARLRPGALLSAKARVGNFVEVKNATIGEGAKANHLAYIGDADVGARANIGAGMITCNYDGVSKHRTEIGEDAFIGSNSALVAPVKVGRGAYVGSGSVITGDVEEDALAVARGRQRNIRDWAARFRKQGGAKKKSGD